MRIIIFALLITLQSCSSIREENVLPAVVGIGMSATIDPAAGLFVSAAMRYAYWMRGKENARAQAEAEVLQESVSSQE